MAYTNGNGQTRVGVRIVPLSVVIPTISALLDSYSGAAAAYSLRKLSATYTGSAIRVRRSSDNTELNIGFDSVGNLDTVALSVFVGTGNGFVTTWYDQSLNNNHAAQTTSSYQPQIVSDGSILTTNGKPSIKLDGVDDLLFLSSTIFTNTSNYHSFVGKRAASGDRLYGLAGEGGSGYNYALGLWTGNNYLLQAKTGAYQYSNSTDTTTNQLLITGKNVSGTMSIYKNNTIIPSTQFSAGIAPNINSIGRAINTFFPAKCSLQEIVFYNNDQTSNQTGIESNINTYYSVYPNPTSVWNLLNAVYSADTTALPSLKTSLVSSYNGESNTNDSFGSNNGTAVGGVTYTTGKIGDAFQFNGSTSYVSLPNDSLNFTGDFTVNAWFNSSTYTGLRGIASSYKVVGSLAYGWIATHDDSLNKFGLYFRDGSNTMLYRTYAGIPLNSYHMITWVRKVGQDPKIYINGVYSPGEYTFGNSSSNPSYQTGQPCNLGGWNNTSYGNHKQDATNFWSKALTQSEITELYNSGNGAQYIGDNFYKPTVNDALGTNNGTAVGGLTYGLGKVGTAFVGNGTNAYITLANNSFKFTNSQSFSISTWVNITNSNVSNIIFSSWLYSGSQGCGWMLRTTSFSSTNCNLDFVTDWQGGTGTPFALSVSNAFAINTWVFVTATRNGSTGVEKLYVNGSQMATRTLIPTYLYTSNTVYPSILAQKYDSSSVNGYLNGKVDALNVWNKELSATEITELYNSGNGKQYPN